MLMIDKQGSSTEGENCIALLRTLELKNLKLKRQ